MQVIDDTFEILQPQNFIFYQGFFTMEAAEDFKSMLAEANIQLLIEKTKYFGERLILGDVNQFPIVLKVLKTDLSRIPEAIQMSLEKQPSMYFENHPLNLLNNNELNAILENTDGESYETFFTAIKILELRGLMADKQSILSTSENSYHNKTKKVSKTRLILIFIMMVSGLAINWIIILIAVLILMEYIFGKSYDGSGNKVMAYDIETRSISKAFLTTGLLINILTIVYLYSQKSTILFNFFNIPFLYNY